MEEVKIWNYIVKWGVAQNPDLSSNPEDWLLHKIPFYHPILKIGTKYEMTSWIGNKPELYEFKLLLRGIRDRFTRDTFWNLCDKQKNLVIVIKVKDTNEILGRLSYWMGESI
ncbi:hypothetical protein C2G38_2265578 [Gigaspora rosea]|uniref:TLDc domain-containing protein n=1 Tax=Gigaspora rosea TaxID=44941 RepID=A0A397UIK2_9GLOM|nr:hypothetical protein C2G38_2265578 [Gigaspora rosea]